MTGAIVDPKILPAPRSPDVKQDHEKRHRLTQAQNLANGIGSTRYLDTASFIDITPAAKIMMQMPFAASELKIIV